ncbi:ribbon-helix-helix domain-containing protein [Archaeoglobus sp.]
MPAKGYKSVSLPEDLLNYVEELIKNNKELGYSSVSEFVKEAVRMHLLQVKKIGAEG